MKGGNQTIERPSAKENPKEDSNIQEIIAALAYKFSEEHGPEGGSPLDDWLRAEQVVYQEHTRQAKR
jgi:hypothetical protein